MAQPRRPKETEKARSGLKPGDGAHDPSSSKGPKRPVEEEDTFGGAERTHDVRVRSEKTKP